MEGIPRRKSKSSTTSIMELPESITHDILSRLPVKIIYRCRSVCKTWANFISNPYFSNLYSSRAPIQFLLKDNANTNTRFFLAEVDEDSLVSNSHDHFHVPQKSLLDLKIEDIFPNFSSSRFTISNYNSCNVTGSLVLDKYVPGEPWKPYHIYNPLSGQHIVIRQTIRDPLIPSGSALGLSKQFQLKLLRFLCKPGNSGKGEVDIQTIGTNLWRNLGESPRYLEKYRSAPFVNGVYHWINVKDLLIHSFDFEQEIFRPVPTPLFMETCNNDVELGSLQGCLSICNKRNHPTKDVELWMMNEYGIQESWTKKFVIREHTNIFFPPYFLEPLRRLKNGEVLMLYRHCNVICYNPITRRSRYIKFCGHVVHNYVVLPYVPSFIRALPACTAQGDR